MSHDDRANAEEYAARGIRAPEKASLVDVHKQRRKDVAAVAATPEGGRVLAWLTSREWEQVKKFRGNSQDAYFLGRWHVARELCDYLEEVLPRSRFLEIRYPHEEEAK